MTPLVMTAERARLLVTLTEVERITEFTLEPSYAAIAVTLGDGRVVFINERDEILEYPTPLGVIGPPVAWPTRPEAQRNLRALYPTLARRQQEIRP